MKEPTTKINQVDMRHDHVVLAVAYECAVKKGSLIEAALVPLLRKYSAEKKIILSCSLNNVLQEEIAKKQKRFKTLYGIDLIVRRKNNLPLVDIVKIICYLYKLIITERVTIVHARGYLPALVLLLISKCKKYNFVFDPRGILEEELAYESGLYSRMYLPIIRKVEKWCLQRARCSIFVSSKMKEYLEYKHNVRPVKSVIIYNRPNKEVFNIGNKHFGKTTTVKICYVGGLSKHQHIEAIISTMALLNRRLDAMVTFFIPPEGRNYVTELAAKYSFNNYDIMHCNNEDLAKIIIDYDYGLLLRDDSIINIVSAPIKFCEYIYSGLRVIMTDQIGDYSIIARDYNVGLILPANKLCDPAYLAEEIIKDAEMYNQIEPWQKVELFEKVINYFDDNYETAFIL